MHSPAPIFFLPFNPEMPLQGEKGGSVVTDPERSLLTQEKVVEFKTDALASDKSHSRNRAVPVRTQGSCPLAGSDG